MDILQKEKKGNMSLTKSIAVLIEIAVLLAQQKQDRPLVTDSLGLSLIVAIDKTYMYAIFQTIREDGLPPNRKSALLR